jgi:hypothetical protein
MTLQRTLANGDDPPRRGFAKDEQYASDVVKKLVTRIAAAANVSTASLQRGNPLHVTE